MAPPPMGTRRLDAYVKHVLPRRVAYPHAGAPREAAFANDVPLACKTGRNATLVSYEITRRPRVGVANMPHLAKSALGASKNCRRWRECSWFCAEKRRKPPRQRQIDALSHQLFNGSPAGYDGVEAGTKGLRLAASLMLRFWDLATGPSPEIVKATGGRQLPADPDSP
jgi:hypothetical protein